MNRRALTLSLVISTFLQVAMMVAGHWSPAVAALFAFGGMAATAQWLSRSAEEPANMASG